MTERAMSRNCWRAVLRCEDLESRVAPSAGLVSVGVQPAGGLSGKIVYLHAGHGYTANNLGNGAWSFQRPITHNMIEDLGNLDQMAFLADYLFRAGATVVPLRPVGHQKNEVVLDNVSPGVTFHGNWANSGSTIYFGNPGEVPYRFASTALTETAYARYRPNIPEAGFYPVYCWTRHGSDRAVDHLYRVKHSGGITEVTVNHRRVGNGLVYLGTYHFEAGTQGWVDISNRSSSTGSVVIADMIRFGNGMGDINRGGGISGLPREDESGLYWVMWHVDRAQGVATSTYRASNDDGTASVSFSPRYAAYMNREQHGSLADRVFVSFHSNAGNGSSRGVLALYNGNNNINTRTPNQPFLAEKLGKEINDDLVAQNGMYEFNWFDRGNNVTLDRADIEFGEINNLYINNEFDATIVEVAFHDNEQDAKLLRDPKVRDALARATYQGLIQYFRGVDGNSTPAVPLPGKVSHFAAVSQAPGSVTLSWQAPAVNAFTGGAATSYRIYASTNGYGFDGGTLVSGTTATLQGYDPTRPYYFKVAAVNAGGESPHSEVLAVIPAGGPKQLLVVNGFDRLDRALNPRQQGAVGSNIVERVRPRQSNSFDYSIQVAEAVHAARPGVRIASTSNEAVISGSVNLQDYHTVVWILGEESVADRTFNAIEQQKVETFIAGGGNLFVSGAEIAWDLDNKNNGKAFFHNTLKGKYVADSANSYKVSGAAGGPFAGLSFQFDNGTLFYDAEFADVIGPQAGAQSVLTYGTGGSAGIVAPGTNGRGTAITLGFPFETITLATQRQAVMDRVLTLLNLEADTTPPQVSKISAISPNGTYVTGQTVTVSVQFSEPVFLTGGSLHLSFNSGGQAQIAPFSGTIAVAVYTIEAGQSAALLNVSGLSLASGAELKDEAGNPASLALPSSNLANHASIAVNPPPAANVLGYLVNQGQAQRSRLTDITLFFTAPINPAVFNAPGAITLTRTGGGPATVVQTGATGAAGRINIAPATGPTTSLHLTFDNADGAPVLGGVQWGSLADGRWQLAIPMLNFATPHNGTHIRRLFGDGNGDGSVDALDFAQFGAAFGSSPSQSPFDQNADGTVDTNDFAAFGNRFGVSN